MKRREVLKNIVLSGAAVAAAPLVPLAGCAASTNVKTAGRVHHSVCRWTYDFLSLEELCKTVKQIGFSAIDLVGPKELNI